MNRKFLLGSAIAATLMLGANFASACAITAWSSATGLTVADTGEPGTNFKRYSGRCSLRVNAVSPKFVQDNTPADETSYRERFYYFTGDITGETDIMRARNTATTNIIRVTHDGAQLKFYVNGTATTTTIPVVDNKYYSVELAWAAAPAAAPTTGSLTGTVTGASGASALALVAGTINITGISNTADRITDAQMGLISGGTAVTLPVFFDEFDSRRTTDPRRLCRGDAALPLNKAVNVFDAVAIVNDAGGLPANLSIGQPDANEDGVVSVFDAVAAVAIAGGTQNICP